MKGSPFDMARYGVVRTWKGPHASYAGGLKLQLPTDLVRKNGVWTVTAAPGESDVNIGLEWTEPRSPRTVTITYADAQSAPEANRHELQVWLNPERPLEGGQTTWQGEWRVMTAAEGLAVRVRGLTWTYEIPFIQAGVFKLRVVLKGKTSARIAEIRATGPASWREEVFDVRFDRPVSGVRFEGFNAEIVQVRPISGGYRVKTLASDAHSDSNDRAIVTVRAVDKSFSFLLNDLGGNEQVFVRPFGAKVTRPGAAPPAPGGRTITERVLAMPEQTYDGAMKAIPPKRRTKWLVLSPPLNPRKFAIRPDGDVFARHEQDVVYRFATGDEPDYDRCEPQHVEDDHLPVLYADWREGSLSWNQGYVVTSFGGRFDDPTSNTVLVTRVSAKNEGDAPATARLWLCLRGGEGECADVRVERGVLYEQKRPRAFVEAGEWGVEVKDRQVAFSLTLPAGEERALEIAIPYTVAEGLPAVPSFKAARSQNVEYWTSKLAEGATFSTPDERVNRIWKSLLIHQYCWGDYDPETGICLPNVGAFDYGPVGNESSQMAKALDFLGHTELARKYYEPMWTAQGTNNLSARVTNGDGCLVGWWPGYVFNTGFILWNLGNHYRLTGDRAWLEQIVPNMIKACDWLAEQRKTTVASGLIESGFFPPCGLEDEERWFYWVMTNGYFYLGISTVAGLLKEIGHADADRIAREAAAYLKHLRRGIGESIVRCPVVGLRDGTFVPYVPKHLYERARAEGHYEAELGALHLLTCNVFAPKSKEMDWTLSFLEDSVFMTEAPSHDSIICYDHIERDWFHLGGYGKTQPYLVHTQIAYLRRDQPKLFLRSFWNQLVAQNYSDINAFPEHICWHGAADCKTYEEAMWLQQFRSMLVFDEDNELRLCAAAPREWFKPGKDIKIRNAPTFFGPVTYEIHSAPRKITALVEFAARKKPKSFTIRFRHPKEARIKSVRVNGKPWNKFDASREIIELPAKGGKLEVEAHY